MGRPEQLAAIPPSHELGYSETQLQDILDDQEYNRFSLWLRGQTIGVVDGEMIVYPHDFHRWLQAGPILD